MPQNISDYTGFTTDYDAGVPTDSDDADIAKAIQRYHYGATYEGIGAPDGIEGHLRQLQNNIDAVIPNQTGNAGKVLGTDGTSASWVDQSGGVPGDWTSFTISVGNDWSAADDTSWNGNYYVVGKVCFLHIYTYFGTGSTFGTDSTTTPDFNSIPVPAIDTPFSSFTYGTDGLYHHGTVQISGSNLLLFAENGDWFTYTSAGIVPSGVEICIDMSYRCG